MPSAISDEILHAYPYPIAKCYERLIRTRDVFERRDQLRFLFDVTIKYCSCVAIAQYLRAASSDPGIDAALTCLSRPSMGHWTNLLRHCLRQTPDTAMPGLHAAMIERTRDRSRLVEGFNAIRSFLEPDRPSTVQSVSVLSFAEAMVAYRNRSVGHGAPPRDHVERFTPILEAALVDMLKHLEVVCQTPLVYLAEIRVERHRLTHVMTRYMGASPVAMSDYVTTRDSGLVGHDRSLLLFDPDRTAATLTLHPLLVLALDEVFVLQGTDLRRVVEYLCHHTGRVYEADNILEDFRDRFAKFFGEHQAAVVADLEAVYISCLTISLLDGVIGSEERAHLTELATRLGIPPQRAEELEKETAAKMNQGSPSPVSATHAEAQTPDAGTVGSVTSLFEQQACLLKRLGNEVLEYLRQRVDPTRSITLAELARALAKSGGAFRDVSPQQLARLIGDVQNHGLAPGLVRTPTGYAVIEDHIAFKITRDTNLKQEIAKAAVRLICSGMKIGMDGGSTTLPLAEELILAVDADMLTDLTIVTNSVTILRRFAAFIERRGWSDGECPVNVLVCSGRLRAVTEAVAEIRAGTTLTRDSLAALLEHLGGLDYAFVGGNGLTATGGITMPTDVELATKRLLLEAATAPYIVADVTKFGLIYPVRIANWDERLTVLTNRPATQNAELDRILALPPLAKIAFADQT